MLGTLLKAQQERIDDLNAREIGAEERAGIAAKKADEAEADSERRRKAISDELVGLEAGKTRRMAEIRDEVERAESVAKQDVARWGEANRKAKEDFDRDQALRQREKLKLQTDISTLTKELDALHERTRR